MSKTTAEKIEELEKQLEELKQEILNQEKWTPPAGNFGLYSDGFLNKDPSEKGFQMFGTEFKTESDGMRAQRDFKFFHWLWHLANELNEGWEPDWNDSTQEKYNVYRDLGNFRIRIFTTYNFGIPCFKSQWSAHRAIDVIKQWDWYWGEK